MRGTVIRRLSHVPFGWRPTILEVRHRRYRCSDCRRVWRQDLSQAAEPRSKLTRGALDWALHGLVVEHLSVSRIAACLAVSWNTANDAVIAEGHRKLIDDPARFDGVRVIGVDEHVWRHTRRGGKYVTVIIDLTPVREKTGPSRLLDMVEGRSKKVFKEWLADQSEEFRTGIEVVAMDGFSGFKTATAEELPEAQPVMDPFHVVKLAGDAVTACRQRLQQATEGHRGRKCDPLYRVRRALLTGYGLLSDKRKDWLWLLFNEHEKADAYTPLEATWRIYQKLIAAYRHKNRKVGRRMVEEVIAACASGVPAGLVEIRKLGRTLKHRAADVVAFFDHEGSSNGPTEAINGRLEHLRGSALGFRNLAHYIARSLLETGGFRPRLHPEL